MQFLKDRIKSFGFAFRGMRLFFKSGPHAKIHAIAALLVLLGGTYFKVSAIEWALLILSIAIVFAAEAFNTAIEELADIIEPDFDKRIGRIKDISAGAVLFLVFGSLIIGGFVFLPRILSLFEV
jgi:diacylglycerol kinase (ATP)